MKLKTLNMDNLIVEIGKKYSLRNGLKTSPIRKANNGTNYIFEADVMEEGYKNKSVLAWKKNGKFLADTIEHEKDIINPLN